MHRPDKRLNPSLPKNQAWLVNGFVRFARRMMRKQFHALAVHDLYVKELRLPPETPLIVFGNHPGWWDPIMAGLLRAECFPDRLLYAPIDAQALQQYKILSQMGFYGLELNSRNGASEFLATSRAILATPNTSIWLTPEGRFTDVRDRTTELMPGLAHLASSTPHLVAIPLAIEYCFWEERLPEALAMFGRPLIVDQETPTSKIEWNNRLKLRLRETQDELAERSIHRKTEEFRILLTAHGASWSWFNGFRRLGALLRGQKFRAEHGQKLKPPQESP
jgi:1-acyl-sn-glycerol-3-phosphate acyltransferase